MDQERQDNLQYIFFGKGTKPATNKNEKGCVARLQARSPAAEKADIEWARSIPSASR